VKEAKCISKLSYAILSIVIAATLFLSCSSTRGVTRADIYQPYALFQNFVVPDPLFGNNGLPSSPAVQMSYGPYGHILDSDGNELDGAEEYIGYFNGKYYYFGSSYSYGTFAHAPGTRADPINANTPVRAAYRFSGITIYESDDLMNWRFIDRWIPQDDNARILSLRKVRVIYCENTGKYLMWALSDEGAPYSGLVVAEANRPEGPWGNIRLPTVAPGLPALGHDHNLCIGPDGTGYIDTAAFTSAGIYKLNDTFDGVVEYKKINISTSLNIHGGSGLFYRDGWWYLGGSQTCGNCLASQYRYIRARDPMGPWEEPDTGIQESDTYAITPVVLSEDSGYSQSKGIMKLPDINGNLHFFIPMCHYISSPTGAPRTDSVTQAGDNNFALNGNCWIPLEFDAEGHILPLKFEPSAKFPLARSILIFTLILAHLNFSKMHKIS
jgi:YHS domain-containing protein